MLKKKKKGYTSVPLSFNRKAVIASASVTKQKNAIHSFAEVDVTEPRCLIREYQNKTGERFSFTAYIVVCLARLIKQYPRFNSFIKGNNLIVLDDLTISVLIERDITGEKVPEPIGIKEAQNKSYRQIHNEIRDAQRQTGDRLGSSSGMEWFRFIPNILLTTFVRMADKNIRMGKAYGKVAVTAIGMYGENPIWFIPHGTATVLITIGGINQKTIKMDDHVETREYLCLTASFDHNIIDGAPAAKFVSQLIDNIKSGDIIKKELMNS